MQAKVTKEHWVFDYFWLCFLVCLILVQSIIQNDKLYHSEKYEICKICEKCMALKTLNNCRS